MVKASSSKKQKHKPSIISRRVLRRANAKQHTESHPHKNPYYVVQCELHGTFCGRNMPYPKWVKVNQPLTKRERMDGCPKCKKHTGKN